MVGTLATKAHRPDMLAVSWQGEAEWLLQHCFGISLVVCSRLDKLIKSESVNLRPLPPGLGKDRAASPCVRHLEPCTE